MMSSAAADAHSEHLSLSRFKKLETLSINGKMMRVMSLYSTLQAEALQDYDDVKLVTAGTLT